MIILAAFLLGIFAGLRSLTPLAAAACAARVGWMRLDGPLALIGSLPALIIFTLLAIVELVADKLPNTPNRTAAVGLTARIITGAFAGGCVASAGGHFFLGMLFGAV